MASTRDHEGDDEGKRRPVFARVWASARPFTIGALAGCCSATLMTPLDLVKVRQQITGESAYRVARRTWKADGLRGFYAGISAVWLRQVVYKGAVLGLYDVFSGAAAGGSETPAPLARLVLCASGAAGCAAVVGNPVDRALVLMQANYRSKRQARPYAHVGEALLGIVRTEGGRGLLRGVGATAARAVSLNASFLAGNTYLKEVICPQLFPVALVTQCPYVITVCSAVSAGFLSCVTSLPADFVKVTLQSQQKSGTGKQVYAGPLDCVRETVRTRGVLAFYTGFGTYVAKQAPMATLTLLFQDALKRVLHTFRSLFRLGVRLFCLFPNRKIRPQLLVR
ncbi:unnamed protein product [Amoebophrya sp. A120]|nr:unnamed protein product [Amoebophrya sp. A120]|eukprot:GSA120T00017513001.1